MQYGKDDSELEAKTPTRRRGLVTALTNLTVGRTSLLGIALNRLLSLAIGDMLRQGNCRHSGNLLGGTFLNKYLPTPCWYLNHDSDLDGMVIFNAAVSREMGAI